MLLYAMYTILCIMQDSMCNYTYSCKCTLGLTVPVGSRPSVGEEGHGSRSAASCPQSHFTLDSLPKPPINFSLLSLFLECFFFFAQSRSYVSEPGLYWVLRIETWSLATSLLAVPPTLKVQTGVCTCVPPLQTGCQRVHVKEEQHCFGSLLCGFVDLCL